VRDNLQTAVHITETIINRAMTKLARYNYSKQNRLQKRYLTEQ